MYPSFAIKKPDPLVAVKYSSRIFVLSELSIFLKMSW
jgi:hypothetical protein